MAFGLWADEKMTAKAGGQAGHFQVAFDLSAQVPYRDFVFYLGSPEAGRTLQTAQNGGTDNVTVSVADALADRADAAVYQVGDVVEPSGGNGWIYSCVTAGTSAGSAPVWIAAQGANVTDGTVVWRCIGRRYQPSNVKLALSAADLATGGSTLALGTEIRGGAAVAVHVRITRITDKYALLGTPQLALVLNDCVEI